MDPTQMNPSFLALDRCALGAADAPDELGPEASAHVAHVRVPAGAVPGWVRELGPRRGRRWLPTAAMVSTAVVALAILVVVTRGGPLGVGDTETQMTQAKGAAEIAIYVKRDSRVFVWNTEDALLAGDSFRLRIAPAGFSQVAVLTEVDGALRTLHKGAVAPSEPTLLEAAWTLDAESEDDVIVVVLAHRELAMDEIRAALAEPSASPTIWTKRIRLRAATQDR